MTLTAPGARASRAGIVAAAAALVREQGAPALTTRAVADAAGVQPPAIYRLFGDKQGLVRAVAEQVMADYVASKASSAQISSDPVEALRAGWRMHVEFGLTNPDFYVLMSDDSGTDADSVVNRGAEVLRGHLRRLAETGRLRVSEKRGVDMIHATGHGVVLALLDQPVAERDPGLSDAVLDAVLAAIVVAPDLPAETVGSELATCLAFLAVVDDLTVLSEKERGLLTEWLRRVITSLR